MDEMGLPRFQLADLEKARFNALEKSRIEVFINDLVLYYYVGIHESCVGLPLDAESTFRGTIQQK